MDPKAVFISIGLEPKKAEESVKNKSLCVALMRVLESAGALGGCDKATGVLYYNIATKLPAVAVRHEAFLAQCVASKKIDSQVKLDAAILYLKPVGGADLNEAEFNDAAGVGVTCSPEQISASVASVIAARKDELLAVRYKCNVGQLLIACKTGPVRFADGKLLKSELDAQLLALLGPKTAADDAKPVKKAAAPVEAKQGAQKVEEKKEEEREWKLPAPTDNMDYTTKTQRNKPEILKKHLETTGGKYLTRFPPEPNGYLHLGHAKAMLLDFGLASQQGGHCYLRYDDTNPEAESQEFMDTILETVKWLGHKPWKVTFSSDYFQQLYDLAVELIKRDKAYVCLQTSAEMCASRERKEASPYRNRPIAESLTMFDNMRKGKYPEGYCTLRMKQDITSPNPNMWDLVAYRVKYTAHPHTGDKWCVYPSYDYTHCIVDSLENVTHSMCTLEFESRHESYMWLLDQLDLYKPHVWEFSRLQLTHIMLSKRKLTVLVQKGIVRGWDDPRMPTLVGLRRRGYTPKTINRFCQEIGVTRRGSVTHSLGVFEQVCRDDLDTEALRALCVLDPIRVVITDWKSGETLKYTAPNHPRDKSMGSRELEIGSVVFIDRSDFRAKDEKDYFGLAPGKTVTLKYAFQITCTDVVTGAGGKIEELRCTHNPQPATKTKGVLHWVSEKATRCEVRQYDRLFKSERAGDCEDWMTDLNPLSEVVIPDALVEPSITNPPEGSRFQFERVGFYVRDKDSTPTRPVFNRVVTMKDSYNL